MCRPSSASPAGTRLQQLLDSSRLRRLEAAKATSPHGRQAEAFQLAFEQRVSEAAGAVGGVADAADRARGSTTDRLDRIRPFSAACVPSAKAVKTRTVERDTETVLAAGRPATRNAVVKPAAAPDRSSPSPSHALTEISAPSPALGDHGDPPGSIEEAFRIGILERERRSRAYSDLYDAIVDTTRQLQVLRDAPWMADAPIADLLMDGLQLQVSAEGMAACGIELRWLVCLVGRQLNWTEGTMDAYVPLATAELQISRRRRGKPSTPATCKDRDDFLAVIDGLLLAAQRDIATFLDARDHQNGWATDAPTTHRQVALDGQATGGAADFALLPRSFDQFLALVEAPFSDIAREQLRCRFVIGSALFSASSLIEFRRLGREPFFVRAVCLRKLHDGLAAVNYATGARIGGAASPDEVAAFPGLLLLCREADAPPDLEPQDAPLLFAVSSRGRVVDGPVRTGIVVGGAGCHLEGGVKARFGDAVAALCDELVLRRKEVLAQQRRHPRRSCVGAESKVTVDAAAMTDTQLCLLLKKFCLSDTVHNSIHQAAASLDVTVPRACGSNSPSDGADRRSASERSCVSTLTIEQLSRHLLDAVATFPLVVVVDVTDDDETPSAGGGSLSVDDIIALAFAETLKCLREPQRPAASYVVTPPSRTSDDAGAPHCDAEEGREALMGASLSESIIERAVARRQCALLASEAERQRRQIRPPLEQVELAAATISSRAHLKSWLNQDFKVFGCAAGRWMSVTLRTPAVGTVAGDVDCGWSLLGDLTRAVARELVTIASMRSVALGGRKIDEDDDLLLSPLTGEASRTPQEAAGGGASPSLPPLPVVICHVPRKAIPPRLLCGRGVVERLHGARGRQLDAMTTGSQLFRQLPTLAASFSALFVSTS